MSPSPTCQDVSDVHYMSWNERERERERGRESQASALLQSETEETLAAWQQATDPTPAERGMGDKRSTEAAAAAEHIQEAASLARAIELPGVESHLAAAATSLRLTMGELGTRRGQPRPSPNAFEIAALMVGILADQCLTEGETTAADLAEVLELVQAGQGLLWGGVRSSNWQRTHDATDAAEEAEALLQALMETGEPPDEGDLTRLHNQLEAAADGVKVLVGVYPHKGPHEQVEALSEAARREKDPPEPQHVLRAAKLLRKLIPFPYGDVLDTTRAALRHLDTWTTQYWGGEGAIQIASDDDDVGTLAASASSPTTTAAGEKAARTKRTSTTAADQRGEPPEPEKSELLSPARRRGFTSPSSLDQDD